MTEMMEFFKEMGAKGGKKRAETLSPERQSEIGKKAAKARWAKKKAAAKSAKAKGKTP